MANPLSLRPTTVDYNLTRKGSSSPLWAQRGDAPAFVEPVQHKFPVASFTVNGRKCAFPIIFDTAEGGNRIVAHERPYREGAKLDSTGSRARQWQLHAVFNNTIDEPGIDEGNEGEPLYPNVMQRMIWLSTQQATGDLIVPVDGKSRAKLVSWNRSHAIDEEDQAILVLTFMEDNEDRIDAGSFSKPSVSGSANKLAEQVQFAAESEGVWNGDLIDIRELCGELVGLMRAPRENAEAIETKIRAIRRSVARVKRTAAEESSAGGFFSPPARIFRELARISDVVGFASVQKEIASPSKKRVWYTVKSRTSIYAISAALKQPVDELLELNVGRIDDPFVIEPGFYKVYESWP